MKADPGQQTVLRIAPGGDLMVGSNQGQYRCQTGKALWAWSQAQQQETCSFTSADKRCSACEGSRYKHQGTQRKHNTFAFNGATARRRLAA